MPNSKYAFRTYVQITGLTKTKTKTKGIDQRDNIPSIQNKR